MIKLSNPRTTAVIEDWPFGSKRVTATFECETNKRGTRVNRVTTGKPKRTTYFAKAVIVDGDDGKTYILSATGHGQIVLTPGTLKYPTYFYEKDAEWDEYKPLLAA